MKFSNETDRDEGVRLGSGSGPRVLWSADAPEWIAEQLYIISDRNPQIAGFCSWKDLPDHVKDVWIRRAQEWLSVIIPKLYLSKPLDETVASKDQQRQLMKELDSISGEGALGRKCSKCGASMVHYRLKGYQCLNPSCPGPYGGGRP